MTRAGFIAEYWSSAGKTCVYPEPWLTSRVVTAPGSPRVGHHHHQGISESVFADIGCLGAVNIHIVKMKDRGRMVGIGILLLHRSS